MSTFPIVMTAAGLQPQTPAALQAELLALVAASNPGYTAVLPGSLIEDVSSTDVGALLTCDQAAVETVNSLTPYGANEFLLIQLGNIYGVPYGQDANTSVNVVFTGPAGYIIAQGFTVGDGTYQYVLQDGGIIGSGGTSLPLFAVATVAGSWVVPPDSVVNLVTSVPSTISLSVTNPEAGTPSAGAETEEDYRARVLQAGIATAQGVPQFLKTQLGNVPGVQTQLISVRQVTNGWEVICGGGDPYQVANAIYTGVLDVTTLQPSVIAIAGITQANPGVVSTSPYYHGLTTGDSVTVIDSDPANYNGTYTATVVSPTEFSIGVNTTDYPSYVSGAEMTPNPRNITVAIDDYPDTYDIVFVNPPQMAITMTVTWNTNSLNYVSPTAVAQLAAPAIIAYVNSIPVGAPINQFELVATFQAAVVSILPTPLLTRLVFAVSINGVGVSPESGTGIIAGDPEGYFYADSSAITINRG